MGEACAYDDGEEMERAMGIYIKTPVFVPDCNITLPVFPFSFDRSRQDLHRLGGKKKRGLLHFRH